MTAERRTTPEQAREVGDQIGVDWDRFDLEQFRAGMDSLGRRSSRKGEASVRQDPLLRFVHIPVVSAAAAETTALSPKRN